MNWMEIYDLIRSLWVVWLMLLFVGVVAWAYWPRNKSRFESYGNIPLRDDEDENASGKAANGR